MRLTSHYLRKRFHSIAQKTAMPLNDWDYLMGDKMSAGHEASTYTLEYSTEIINEYDRYLAPYLSLREPRDPLDAKEPNSTSQTILLQTIEELRQTIASQTKLLERVLQEKSHR